MIYQIQAFFYAFLAALTNAAQDEYEKVKPRAEEIVEDTRKSLEALARKALDKEIALEDVPKHLEQELHLLKTELLEIAVLGVSFAEEQINDLTEKFNTLLKSLLPEDGK